MLDASQKRSRWIGWTIIGLSVLVAGCAVSGPQQVRVTGTVTLDGVPIAEGSINFFPVEGTRGPTAGATIDNGDYEIEADKGVVVGSNRVEITAPRKTGKMVPDPMTPDALVEERVEAVPAKYNTKSTLIREIHPGPNRIDFDLSSAGMEK